ncbi:MAG: hypothetical protein LJE70_00810 [Chromatiaceae bacterium]|jgi:hypothetical protein|nr:hypothetical protein [Chromatiaceae bacterium]
MVTRSRILVLVILVLIVVISAWSRLRFIDDKDFEPQRIRLDEHPAFRKNPAGGG